MHSFTISQDSESFDIRDRDYQILDVIKDAMRCGAPLYWNKQGIVGKLSVAVLKNAIEVYSAYKELKQRGRITDLPAASYTITWDQTEEHHPASSRRDQAE